MKESRKIPLSLFDSCVCVGDFLLFIFSSSLFVRGSRYWQVLPEILTTYGQMLILLCREMHFCAKKTTVFTFWKIQNTTKMVWIRPLFCTWNGRLCNEDLYPNMSSTQNVFLLTTNLSFFVVIVETIVVVSSSSLSTCIFVHNKYRFLAHFLYLHHE